MAKVFVRLLDTGVKCKGTNKNQVILRLNIALQVHNRCARVVDV